MAGRKPYSFDELLCDEDDRAPSGVRVRFLGFSVNRTTRRSRHPRHQHLQHELIFPSKGEYRCLLNQRELRLGAEQALTVLPGDWHEDLFAPGMFFYGTQFDILVAQGGQEQAVSLLREGLEEEQRAVDLQQDMFDLVLNRIADENKTADLCSGSLQDILLQELFWRFLRCIPQDIVSPHLLAELSRTGLARRLNRVFENALHSHLTVGEMAVALGMSQSSLAHQCRAQLGVSPAKAQSDYRIRRARELLRSTTMSIKQVSAFLGYQNQFHFSRVFRRSTGRSPRFYIQKRG